MSNPSDKIICAFCGGAMVVDFVEQVKGENKSIVLRTHFTCKHAGCGRPFIDGKSKADCMAKARELYSKKAREHNARNKEQ
mgnify:CR=1 FL=1